jgi:hypothetical protein
VEETGGVLAQAGRLWAGDCFLGGQRGQGDELDQLLAAAAESMPVVTPRLGE